MKLPYYKISYWVFYLLMVISAIVFGVFVFVGYDNVSVISGTAMTDPLNTDLLIYWMYILTALCILCALVATLYQFCVGMKYNPMKTLKSLSGLVLIAVVIFIAYLAADTTPIRLGTGVLVEANWELTITDVALYTQYVLVGAAVICAIVSLTNVVKSSNKIKA